MHDLMMKAMDPTYKVDLHSKSSLIKLGLLEYNGGMSENIRKIILPIVKEIYALNNDVIIRANEEIRLAEIKAKTIKNLREKGFDLKTKIGDDYIMNLQ